MTRENPQQPIPLDQISTSNEGRKLSSCGYCQQSSSCLPIALTPEEIDHLDKLVQKQKPHEKGDYLYRKGRAFTAVYAVNAGSYKSFTVLENGKEQVTGFYFPGDIVGIDGVSTGQYTAEMVALERSSVCRLPFTELEGLSGEIANLRKNLFRAMGKEVCREQKLISMLGSYTGEQRLASFLSHFAQRYADQGRKQKDFQLSMPRSDIANYLGLTNETVSRLFSQMKKKGLIAVDGKRVSILDLTNLQAIFGAELS